MTGPEAAPAKVNLFLHVVGRREDGYHLLDSLAVFPAAGDVLRATAADDLTLEARKGRLPPAWRRRRIIWCCAPAAPWPSWPASRRGRGWSW